MPNSAVSASVNPCLVRVGLSISVDQGQWTRVDHIASAPAIHPMIQEGNNAVTVEASETRGTTALASQPTESAAGVEPCGEPAFSPCLTGPVD